VAAAVLAGPAGASATTSQEAVGFLNQQRAANAIPAHVAFDSSRTTGCQKHDVYMQHEGLRHGEDPTSPWWTPEGADMSSGEVLAKGHIVFTATSNPWDAAPLHQTLLFDPTVNAAGYDENGDFACMRFGFDFGSTPPAYYAFTSDTGRTSVPQTEIVSGEGPYAPQEAVGIRQGVPTGPDILFFTSGVSSDHAVPGSFSLTGPSGPVEVKLVDSTTPAPDGSGQPIFQTGGDLIPVKPLEPLARYDAAVTWEDGNGMRTPQTLSFETGGRAATMSLSLSKRLSRSRRAKLMAPAAAIGQRAVVTLERRSDHHATTRRLVLGRSQAIAVPRGSFTVTVSVASFSRGDTRYTVKPARRSYR
jgi:hypothetical protein